MVVVPRAPAREHGASANRLWSASFGAGLLACVV
jgi:hypothetical protein